MLAPPLPFTWLRFPCWVEECGYLDKKNKKTKNYSARDKTNSYVETMQSKPRTHLGS
jgi:hypothetical protein